MLEIRVIRAAVAGQIADGTLKAGEALPSERTIQETLEVSRSTIRQAIRALVEDGHIQTVPGKGNFILEWAEDSALPNHSRVVGVIADSAALFLYYAQLASAFNHRMRNAGYYIDLALHNHDPAIFDEIIESFIQARAVAVAISPPTAFDINPALQRLKDCGIHIVVIGRRSKSADTDYVDNDNKYKQINSVEKPR